MQRWLDKKVTINIIFHPKLTEKLNEKTFDKVQHPLIIKIPKKTKIEGKKDYKSYNV
jgi:hypothetical protein